MTVGRVEMADAFHPTLAIPRYDVTKIVLLRKRLSRAATSLKIIGFFSAIFLGFYLASFIIAVVTLTCASLIAKRLRSGQAWAVAIAGVWLIVFVFSEPWVFWPKAVRAGWHFDSVVLEFVLLTSLFFLAAGLIAFITHRLGHRKRRAQFDPLAYFPYELGLQLKKRPRFLNWKSSEGLGMLIFSPLPVLFVFLMRWSNPHLARSDWELVGYIWSSSLILLPMSAWGLSSIAVPDKPRWYPEAR